MAGPLPQPDDQGTENGEGMRYLSSHRMSEPEWPLQTWSLHGTDGPSEEKGLAQVHSQRSPLLGFPLFKAFGDPDGWLRPHGGCWWGGALCAQEGTERSCSRFGKGPGDPGEVPFGPWNKPCVPHSASLFSLFPTKPFMKMGKNEVVHQRYSSFPLWGPLPEPHGRTSAYILE